MIPFTSYVIGGRYGAESQLDPVGGSAGKKVQDRQTPPTISAPQDVKHDREQRRIHARRYGGDYDREVGRSTAGVYAGFSMDISLNHTP